MLAVKNGMDRMIAAPLGLDNRAGGNSWRGSDPRPAAAIEFGEGAFRLLDEMGKRSGQSVALLAEALYADGRLDEAQAWASRADELGASDDPVTQLRSRAVRARVLARSGEHAEAERLAREAVALSDETDQLDTQGDAYAALGEVLVLPNVR